MENTFEYRINRDKIEWTEPLLKGFFGADSYYLIDEKLEYEGKDYIKIKCPRSYREFLEIFEDEDISTLLPFNRKNYGIICALYLMSYIFNREHKGTESKYCSEIEECERENFKDQLYDNKARKDLLKLYILSKQEIRNKPVAEQIVIRYNVNDKIELDNVDNWFAKVLLSNHLEKYLPDINSVEQAKEELKIIREVAGRKVENQYYFILIYGVYSMVTTQLQLKKIPNSLCTLITRLLLYVDFITEEEAENRDSMYTRSLIKYLVNKPVHPMFKPREPKLASPEEGLAFLKNSGRDLYENM